MAARCIATKPSRGCCVTYILEFMSFYNGIWVWELNTTRSVILEILPAPYNSTGIRGDKGIKGMKGQIGPPGYKGDNGTIGPKGEMGDNGDKGSKGVVGIIGDQGPLGPPGDIGGPGKKGDRGCSLVRACSIKIQNKSRLPYRASSTSGSYMLQ